MSMASMRLAAFTLVLLATAAARAEEPFVPEPLTPAPAPGATSGPERIGSNEPWMVWRMAIKSGARAKKTARIAIVADGYTADRTEASLQAARSQFISDAKALVNAVKNDPAGWELLLHRNLEFTFVFKTSKQKATLAGTTTTNYGARVVDGFLKLGRENGVVTAISFAAKGLAPDATVTLVKFADPEAWLDVRANAERNGKQGFVRMVAGDASAFVHELGHALFNLGDEYGADIARQPTSAEAKHVAKYPNLSLDGQTTRWRYWTATKPIEGGARFARGVWHAEAKCRMNQCDSEAFCTYCRALIDAHYRVEDERAFHEMLPAPMSLHNASIGTQKVGEDVRLWDKATGYVNDRLSVASGQSFTLRWSIAGVPPHRWCIELEAFQRPTVRVEVEGAATRYAFSGITNGTDKKLSYQVWGTALDKNKRPVGDRHWMGVLVVQPAP